jgi:hypothetical protein
MANPPQVNRIPRARAGAATGGGYCPVGAEDLHVGCRPARVTRGDVRPVRDIPQDHRRVAAIGGDRCRHAVRAELGIVKGERPLGAHLAGQPSRGGAIQVHRAVRLADRHGLPVPAAPLRDLGAALVRQGGHLGIGGEAVDGQGPADVDEERAPVATHARPPVLPGGDGQDGCPVPVRQVPAIHLDGPCRVISGSHGDHGRAIRTEHKIPVEVIARRHLEGLHVLPGAGIPDGYAVG